MKFFTWCDRECYNLERLLKSAEIFGIEVEVLGLGLNFDSYYCKMEWLYSRIENMDDHEILVCTDAMDVLYVDYPESIKEKFLSFSADLVFAAEKWYSHQAARLKYNFDNIPTPFDYKYLNSGTYIGYVHAIKAMIETVLEYTLFEGACTCMADKMCDQTLIGKYFCEDISRIQLDYECQLFWCPSGEFESFFDLAKIDNRQIINRTTQNRCSILHVPLRSKYDYITETVFSRIKLAESKI